MNSSNIAAMKAELYKETKDAANLRKLRLAQQ